MHQTNRLLVLACHSA